jgi:tryptophan synthase
MDGIKQTFAKCKEQKRAALVAYVTAGYPTVDQAVDIMLGLENGGAGTVIQPRWRRNNLLTGLNYRYH